MHILILNWRDIKNPQAGGAEILTHEIGKRMVKEGHKVTQFSSLFPRGKTKEVLDGVTIVRRGSWWSVHFFAYLFYITGRFGHVDSIIDEVHWFPFFSRVYAPRKTILLACEVASKLFFQLFPFPLAVVGRVIEKFYLFLYQKTPVLAISVSTKDALINEGFAKDNITVLQLGISPPQELKNSRKEQRPTIMFLGRLNKLKGIDDAVQVFSIVHKVIPDSMFWIVGHGSSEALQNVKKKLSNNGILGSTTVFGRVSEDRKFDLLARAHVLIVPSVHEGWGLIVPEAGIVKTPAVTYNVPGLRDTIEQRKSGVLTSPTPDAMAEEVLALITDSALLKKYAENAYRRARTYNWDTTGKQVLRVLTSTHEKNS